MIAAGGGAHHEFVLEGLDHGGAFHVLGVPQTQLTLLVPAPGVDLSVHCVAISADGLPPFLLVAFHDQTLCCVDPMPVSHRIVGIVDLVSAGLMSVVLSGSKIVVTMMLSGL